MPRDHQDHIDYGKWERGKEREGYDDGQYQYSRWAKPGVRVPVAIRYVNPRLFRVLY